MSNSSYWWFIAGLLVGQFCGFAAALIGARAGVKAWLREGDEAATVRATEAFKARLDPSEPLEILNDESVNRLLFRSTDDTRTR